nr:PAS domain S-box protein [Methanogenium sp. S4BF]
MQKSTCCFSALVRKNVQLLIWFRNDLLNSINWSQYLVCDILRRSENKISLLCVDDEAVLRTGMKQCPEQSVDFIIHTISSAEDALPAIRDGKYDAVVSGYQLPGMDGLEFLKILRGEGNSIPFILFTGRGGENVVIEALNAGADYYLQKGGEPNVRFAELQNCVRRLVEKNRAEKHRAEMRHPEREERMSAVIDYLPEATFAIDTEGRVIAWNRAIEQMTGISASEMLGKGNYEYALPFYGKRCPILIDLALNRGLQTDVSYTGVNGENGGTFCGERFIPHLRSGEGAYLWFSASPLYGNDGSIIGAVESIRDVTGYKQAEGIYRTAFEYAGAGVAIIEEDGTVSKVNAKTEEIWGYSRAECESKMVWPELVLEADRENLLKYQNLRQRDRDTAPGIFTCRLIHKNGEIRNLGLTVSVIPGTKKSLISFIDISRQKEAENNLKFTQFTADHAPDGILWADTEGRFFSVNQSAVDMFGYPKEELLTMHISDFAPDYPYERFKEFWEIAKKKGSLTFEATVVKKDGSSVTIELNIVFLNFGGQDYECGFARDVTERKNAENALKTLNKKLHLLSSITRHDIGNQICVLLGYGEMLEEEIDNEIAEEYLREIVRATELIERQVAFTREYQELGVHSPTWQSVEDLVRLAASNVSAIGAKVRIETGPLEIIADDMLEKVFYNLIQNAVRHGGNVTDIHVSFHETDGNGVLTVEDNGIGIADDMKEKIFERGVGLNTGFGLFLTREILDITGISISETGTEGKGARFEIVVPKYEFRFNDENRVHE